MRQPYERCKKHDRPYCTDLICKNEETNAGQVTMNTEGHMAMGIGGGLSIDMSDGSLDMNIGGVTIDMN